MCLSLVLWLKDFLENMLQSQQHEHAPTLFNFPHY